MNMPFLQYYQTQAKLTLGRRVEKEENRAHTLLLLREPKRECREEADAGKTFSVVSPHQPSPHASSSPTERTPIKFIQPCLGKRVTFTIVPKLSKN